MAQISQSLNESIYEKQSSPLLIQCFFAQRRYYTYAKIISGLYFCVCVFLVCIFAVLEATSNSDIIGGLSLTLSVVTVFAPSIAKKHSSKMKRIAAEIQQYIDTSLYSDNPYKKTNQRWHCPLNKHQINELVVNFPKKGFTIDDKWYEDYSTKQYWEQIYFCQKENIRWDENLRKKYCILCNSVLTIIVTTVLVLSQIFNPTILKALRFAPWGLPFILYMISFNEHMKKDKERMNQINHKANSILNALQTCNADQALIRESALQDLLFEHRKQVLLIPDAFYRICRSKQQRNEERIAKSEEKDSIQ